MRYIQLGNSGLRASVVGLGTNNFGTRLDQSQVNAVVGKCLDEGVNFFDTADIYGRRGGLSEEMLAKALGDHRDDVIVATKFGMDTGLYTAEKWQARGSVTYIRRAVEDSLRRLNTDYIDLYQYHTPDPLTPLTETLQTLGDLQREGKIRYFGVSNFSGGQIADTSWITDQLGIPPIVTIQNKYSLLARGVELEIIPAAQRAGYSLLPYFPLASGLLTGKYQRDSDAPKEFRLSERPDRLARADFDVLDELHSIAADTGYSMSDLALGWLSSQPVMGAIIVGASRPDQVSANVRSGLLELEAEVLNRVSAATRAPEPVNEF